MGRVIGVKVLNEHQQTDWIGLLLTEDMGFREQREITGEDRVACASFLYCAPFTMLILVYFLPCA